MSQKSNENIMKISLVGLAAFAAFVFAGPKETAKTQQSNINLLPALQQRVSALEGQLNRRIQLEVKDPIYAVIEDLKTSINATVEDAEDNENKLTIIVGKVAKLEAHLKMLNEGGN